MAKRYNSWKFVLFQEFFCEKDKILCYLTCLLQVDIEHGR